MTADPVPPNEEIVAGPADVPVAEPTGVRLAITPFAWLTGFSGDVGVRGVSAEVNKSFFDIVDESDRVLGFMGAVDATYGRLVLHFNGTYTRAEISRERGLARSGPLGGSAEVAAGLDLEIEASWLEACAGYRLVATRWGASDDHEFSLDAFGGLRYTDLELDLNATADATVTLPGGELLEAGRRREISGREAWAEPFIGLGAGVTLDRHWILLVRGDVGGFGVGDSEFAWQALGAVAYRWHLDGWSLAAFAGYRALGQDYETDTFEWDMITHGPLLGLSARIDF